MRIVQELHQLDFGGVERIVRSIIKHDKKNEHTIVAYKDGPFRSKLEEVGAKIIIVGEEEVDLDADVVHIHTGGGVSQLANSIGNELPVIETIHSPVRSAMPDELIYQRVGVCEAVARMNSNAITIKNGLESDLEDLMDPILKDEFDPQGKVVIGRAGRIGYDKGLEDWLLTIACLQNRGMDIVPVVVGGEARDAFGYIGKLKLMAASLPVKNVCWIGHKDDIRTWLRCMDIFLYPSKTEGFGLVFAEAMLAGCAVVAQKTPVTSELFGGHAELVDIDAGIPGLADAVEKIINNSELMSELQNGREFIEGEYQAQRMSEQYQELYDECRNKYPASQSEGHKTDVVLA